MQDPPVGGTPPTPATNPLNLKNDARELNAGQLNANTLFLMALIAGGAFALYVFWHKLQSNKQTADANATATQNITTDNAQLEATGVANENSGAVLTAVESAQAALGAQLNGVNANVSGTREDASIALNGVNQLLGSKPTPVPVSKKAAPAPTVGTPHLPIQTKPVSMPMTAKVPAKKPATTTTGKGYSSGSMPLASSGLSLPEHLVGMGLGG